MNFKINLALIFSFITLMMCMYLLFTKSKTSTEPEKTKETNVEASEEPKVPPIEIAHFMTRIQVFHNKLYFAGMNKNTELTQFYLNEMEEEMGTIAEAGIFEIDVNISDNIKVFGIKQVELMRTQINKGFDTFENDFDQLTLSCNSCHAVAGFDHVKIITPTSPIFTNQDYGKKH